MFKGRGRFAALLAGAAAPIYFVIQLVFGSEAGEAAIRAVIFFAVLFLVSLAIDWDKQAGVPPQDTNELPPRE